ncbi:hypothetical protein DSLASN_38930 [Desulfoluna limicola]|uniref:BK channel n=1 Tax=Desulfoluna limicola TaxID=2810562 RepID=A0ABN6F830_9BACT|nr:ion transporter [Desulfoluna limicola]BCS98261.1 hypothetical protein DSLASN_38930 [Desulfoluna limicola]
MNRPIGSPQVRSSALATTLELFIVACIFFSLALIPLEILLPEQHRLFWRLELMFTAIFAVEYVVRWALAEKRLVYPFTRYAVIDLLAIAPTLLMVLAEHFTLFSVARSVRLLRVVRFLRLLRLLKFIRYGYLLYRFVLHFRIRFSTLREQIQANQLEKIFLYAFLTWVIGANSLYLTEAHFSVGEEGAYTGYWKSYWHIIIVLFSGIEDKEPLSLPGRIEVTILLIMGICFAGVITGEIVSILVRKIQRLGKITLKPRESRLEHHIIILGHNKHFKNIVRHVHAAMGGRHYILVVSRNADSLEKEDEEVYKRVMALKGNPLDPAILERMDLDSASRVIVLSSSMRMEDNPRDIDNRSLLKVIAVYGRNSTVPMVAELQTEEALAAAGVLDGVEFLVSRHFGERLASQAVLNPGVTTIYDSLMTFSDDSSEFYTVPVPSCLVGKTFRDAQLHFLDDDDEAIIPVGIDRSDEACPNTRFTLCPQAGQAGLSSGEMVFREGDFLVVIAYEKPRFVAVSREALWRGRELCRN